jgi:hypothetical protein
MAFGKSGAVASAVNSFVTWNPLKQYKYAQQNIIHTHMKVKSLMLPLRSSPGFL